MAAVLDSARPAVMLLWCTAGACWVTQLFVPWTTRGTLSSASMLDAVRLVRSDSVDAVVPGWAAAVLLALPAIGLLVGGSVGLAGPVAEGGRIALTLIAVALWVLAFVGLADSDVGRLGFGGWLTAGGAVAAGAAVTCRHVGRKGASGAGAPTRQEIDR